MVLARVHGRCAGLQVHLHHVAAAAELIANLQRAIDEGVDPASRASDVTIDDT
jgi:hypothetical protein